MIDRGSYRSNYEALADDPDFQELSPFAQAVFHTLRLKLGPYSIGVFYPALLSEYHRRSTSVQLKEAIAELEGAKPSGSEGWVRHERNVFWIRNGFRFDPVLSTENVNHRKGALHHARALPQLAIAEAFIQYYELTGADEIHSGRPKKSLEKSGADPISGGNSDKHKSHLKGIFSREESRERERESKTTTTTTATSSARAGNRNSGIERPSVAEQLETDADRAALKTMLEHVPHRETWLAEMEGSLAGLSGHSSLTPAQLGCALREFVGNGALDSPSLRLFRGYLRSASIPPPRRVTMIGGTTVRRRPGDGPRSKPTESEDDIKWT
jgi:hypothetical protein